MDMSIYGHKTDISISVKVLHFRNTCITKVFSGDHSSFERLHTVQSAHCTKWAQDVLSPAGSRLKIFEPSGRWCSAQGALSNLAWHGAVYSCARCKPCKRWGSDNWKVPAGDPPQVGYGTWESWLYQLASHIAQRMRVWESPQVVYPGDAGYRSNLLRKTTYYNDYKSDQKRIGNIIHCPADYILYISLYSFLCAHYWTFEIYISI